MAKEMILDSDPRVDVKFSSYPPLVKENMEILRQLVYEVAAEDEEIVQLEETLKWGEPSFITKQGSTLRMDWKEKNPEHFALYFSCSTILVASFRILYGSLFRYEKNRAILFHVNDELPLTQVKECIRLTLNYHKLKHLPLLGKEKGSSLNIK